ncbi:MAG: hypothetical protein PUE91_09025 [Clostridiales bacterium]|nr:hypothetical protein [Clostridiales bacterium]
MPEKNGILFLFSPETGQRFAGQKKELPMRGKHWQFSHVVEVLGDDKNTTCTIGDDIKHYLGDMTCFKQNWDFVGPVCLQTSLALL